MPLRPSGRRKTSLGKSIADALHRKYVRMSLGGLHDEAEIRGHRKTYIGAMPGRIIQGLIKSGSSNPVFVLDEIDKLGQDFKGDPSSALLEVLDPEQNCHFHDNYIDVDYDLSNILFIATANTLSTLSQPLLDRMELIEVSGYILEEKVEIAKKVPCSEAVERTWIRQKEIDFPKKTLTKIIESYTRESGVRQLEKKIAKILRRIARLKASDKEFAKTISVESLKEYLGPEEYFSDKYEGNDQVGVVTGLAWTAVGGEILFIESSLSKGKGEKLTLTGNLGDVMKESAVIALQYLKANGKKFGIETEKFDNFNVHIHVPEGAIPKDGPSAGITMATSLASAFTRRKVKDHIAMTGEITLRGKVLPVGGIKEKDFGGKTCRHQRNYPVGRKPQRHRRHQADIYQRFDIPLRVDHQTSHRLGAHRHSGRRRLKKRITNSHKKTEVCLDFGFYFLVGTTSIGMSVWNMMRWAMLGLNNRVKIFRFLFGITTNSILSSIKHCSNSSKKQGSVNFLIRNSESAYWWRQYKPRASKRSSTNFS